MNLYKEKNSIEEFVSINSDLLSDELVRSMTEYRHHGDTNTHFHSVYVAYCVLKVCNRFGVRRKRDIVRASLLHDFYLYEWYTEKHDELHIYYHPKESVKNIENHFGSINQMQKDMILSHMFPLSKKVPSSSGGWILTLADKYCATLDYLTHSAGFEKVYKEIVEKANHYAE